MSALRFENRGKLDVLGLDLRMNEDFEFESFALFWLNPYGF